MSGLSSPAAGLAATVVMIVGSALPGAAHAAHPSRETPVAQSSGSYVEAAGTDHPTRAILGSKCTSQTKPIKWRGGLPTGITPAKWPTGRVVLCWYKYRLGSGRDGDPRADYYRLRLESRWTHKGGDRDYPAEMHQTVTSSVGARGNVYKATGGFVSNESCADYLTFSFNIGPFGVTVNPKVCDGFAVNRYIYDDNEAYWKSAKAGGLRVVETTYAQKVPEGVVPKFDIVFGVPRYRNTLCDGCGYWKSEKRLKWFSWSDK